MLLSTTDLYLPVRRNETFLFTIDFCPPVRRTRMLLSTTDLYSPVRRNETFLFTTDLRPSVLIGFRLKHTQPVKTTPCIV